MKKKLRLARLVVSAVAGAAFSASVFASTAIDIQDPSRPMFASGDSWWSALLAAFGLN